MSLELVSEAIKINQVMAKDSAQTIVENDIIVPDTKPDISMILLFDGDVIVDSTATVGGRAVISGTVNYKILYVSDDPDQRIKSINSSVGFTHELEAVENCSDSRYIARCEIDHLEYNLQNSRRINVKSYIRSDYKVTQESERGMISDIRGADNIQVLRNNISVNSYLGSASESFTVSESLELPAGKPSIAEILRNDIKITGKDYKASDDKVFVKGEINLSTLYISDENQSIQFVEHEIPFSQTIDLDDVKDDCACEVNYRLADYRFEIGEDSDGEPRAVNCEIKLDITADGYEKINIETVEDAYSPKFSIALDKEDFRVEDVAGETRSQVVLKDTVVIRDESPEISEVFNVLCKPALSGYQIIDDKVIVEGVVDNSILYLAGSEEQPVFCCNQEIPFRQYIDAKGVKPDMICDLSVDVDHCNYSMISSNEVEIRLVLGVNLKLLNQSVVPSIVRAVESPVDESRLASQPSITVYFAQPGDTLWKVAKKYFTTVDDLKRVNGFADKESLTEGQQILILRKV